MYQSYLKLYLATWLSSWWQIQLANLKFIFVSINNLTHNPVLWPWLGWFYWLLYWVCFFSVLTVKQLNQGLQKIPMVIARKEEWKSSSRWCSWWWIMAAQLWVCLQCGWWQLSLWLQLPWQLRACSSEPDLSITATVGSMNIDK